MISRRHLLSLVFLFTASVLALSADDLAKFKAAGVIKIGSEGDYSPFTFHDATGKIVGFDVEIGQEVAKRLGIKAQFIDGKWDGLIAGLDVNRYDAIINEVTITEARKLKYDFSDPYVVTKPVLIVRSDDSSIKGFADLKGKKVAEDLTTTYAKVAKDYGATVVASNQPFELLLTKHADATINDRLFFLDYRKQKPDTTLKIVASYDSPDYQGIIVRKGNPELLAAINKALADIKADGTYQKLSQKYFGEDVSK
jgi:cystine transport system substrate-binding protein